MRKCRGPSRRPWYPSTSGWWGRTARSSDRCYTILNTINRAWLEEPQVWWWRAGAGWGSSLLLQANINPTPRAPHSPHDEHGETDEDEECAADSDHGKRPEVDLPVTWEGSL